MLWLTSVRASGLRRGVAGETFKLAGRKGRIAIRCAEEARQGCQDLRTLRRAATASPKPKTVYT